MFDAQAWYVRDLILGRLPIPDAETRAADNAAWVARDRGCADPSEQIDFQADYVRQLMAATDYPDLDTAAVAALFKQWEHDKEHDIMGYRNHSYRSVLTGTMSPRHHTVWMEALDDSLEAFLAAGETV
jgi:trimethylamine monooxygenase